MLLVFLRGFAVDENVVYISKTKIQILQNIINETLENLGGVSQTKGHERKFK